MKARVRVGVLIVKKNKLLLIRHVNPSTGQEFWVTPGGGMKSVDDSIFHCAKRETFEECGLKIKLSEKIKFIRQWYDKENNRLQLEIFLFAKSFKGKLTMDNLLGQGADEEWIKELKFLSKEDMEELSIFPESLKKYEKLLKKCKNGAIYIE